jgi:hypothetical protein
MLKLFKRWSGASVARPPRPGVDAPRPRPRPAASSARTPYLLDAPLPEVVAEGNDQTDWGLWEDSVHALDSQMHDLAPSSRIHVRETRPSQLHDIDAFSSVRKKQRRA